MAFLSGEVLVKLIDKIFKLQKGALRTISNSHYRAHTGHLFVKYNILNVYDMHINQKLVYLCVSTQKAHLDSTTFFTTHATRSEIHDYQTRYKDHYHQTRNVRTLQIIQQCSMRTY